MGNTTDIDDEWPNATGSPATFTVRGRSIDLPASEAGFVRFLASTNARYERVGEGSLSLLSSPPPAKNSPCQRQTAAIIFHFSIPKARFTPRYVAYIYSGSVVCVDRQFSYLPRGS